jgi:hypothetical protein
MTPQEIETLALGFKKSLHLCVIKGKKIDSTDVERFGFVHDVVDSSNGKNLIFLDVLRKGPRTYKIENIEDIKNF